MEKMQNYRIEKLGKRQNAGIIPRSAATSIFLIWLKCRLSL